jgi:ribose transport system substrate-binding protein
MRDVFGIVRRDVCAVLIVALMAASPASSQTIDEDGPPGVTRPTVLAPFDPNKPPCAQPPDLQRLLVFAQDNRREFMEGVRYGLALAAADRGMEFHVALADNDPRRMIEQVSALREARIGAVVAAPVDAPSLSRSLQELIWQGSYVGTIVPPPATSLLNAPQYLTGRVLAEEAAHYIATQLDGRARVVLLTHDSLQYLAPRFVAMRDVLMDMPDVTIVADISPVTVNKEGGFAMMQKILLAHPDIDVVLGADTVVLGALAAVRDAGRERPDQFFGGIDGEPEAVAEIKRGGAYKASISLASPIFGFAMGQHAADWLEGRSIPQAMDILPRALTRDNLAQYEADLKNPDRVFSDPKRSQEYLRMYGNICYDTRDLYINFPWSSELR